MSAQVRPRSHWESLLAPIAEEGRGSADAAPKGLPMALLVDVAQAAAGRRYRSASAAPKLQLRPLIRGASGGWIRTGISWSDLQYSGFYGRHLAPAHRDALAAFLHAYRARTPYYYSIPQWIEVNAIGPSLWTLLDEALAAGVTLVTGLRGQSPVHRLEEPATIALDLTRDGEGNLIGRTRLSLPDVGDDLPHGERAEGAPRGPDGTAYVIGDPGHGIFIAEPGALWLIPLRRPLTEAVAGLIADRGPLSIPASDEARFFGRFYPALLRQVDVTSADGSVELPAIEPPRLALFIAFEPGHRTRLRWSFRYAVAGHVAHVPLLRDTPHLEPVVRDADAEEALLTSLGPVLAPVPGLLRALPGKRRPGVIVDPELDGRATVAFVTSVLPALRERDDIDITMVGEPLTYVEATEPVVISVSARDRSEDAGDGTEETYAGDGLTAYAPDDGAETGDGTDWFDLGIVVSVGGQEVHLATLLTALGQGEEMLVLPDGTWFALDVPELQALRRLVDEARALQDHDGDGLQINRFQVGLWEELVALGVVGRQSERWRRSVGALLALDEVPHPPVPEGVTATLRTYQVEGYQWLSFLWEHRLGGILADDMGLGKTLQVLTMAEWARAAGALTEAPPVLVVAPTSVVSTWAREAAKFTPQLRVATVTQTTRRAGEPLATVIAGAHIVVTTYALLRIDDAEYLEQQWGALILDEAQFVKNHQTRTYQVARRLRARVKFAITGTPLENSLMDLWALLSIVAPGLFPTPARFSEVYRRPIESGTAPELLATLRRRIRPLMLRRTKEAVAADLPPKIEQVVTVPLNTAHRRIYDTHLHRERQRLLGLLDDVQRNRIAILTGLTKLRQLSLDVHLVDKEAPLSVRSSKVDALLDQLVEVVAEGHRCLVFSQFTGFLAIVRARLAAEGIRHVYLDGRTRNRPARIAEFTTGTAPVFVISLKAGGSGLTLTEADYVFVLDPWWNPAVEAQAIDRTHRIGQDKTVMVYRLVSEGTIEEKVLALQERKRELFEKVVDEGGLMSAPLTADDIRGLLDAPASPGKTGER